MSTEIFDKAAADWDKKPMRLQLAASVASAIREAIPLHREMHALEIGCGTGLVTLALCRNVGTILATDTSTGMLEALRKKLVELGVENVRPSLLDLAANEAIPGGEKFHLIYSSMALHHIEDTAALLRACARLLEPGGYLAIADLEQEDGTFHSDMAGVRHLGFNPSSLISLAADCGFSNITSRRAHTVQKENSQGIQRSFPVFLLTAQKAEVAHHSGSDRDNHQFRGK